MEEARFASGCPLDGPEAVSFLQYCVVRHLLILLYNFGKALISCALGWTYAVMYIKVCL